MFPWNNEIFFENFLSISGRRISDHFYEESKITLFLTLPPGIFSTLMASWRTATSSCFSPCNLSLKAPSVKSEARAPRQLRQKRRRQREKTLLEFPSGSLPYSPELVTRRRRTRRREKAEITSTKSPFWDKSIKMPKTDFLWQSLVLSPPTPQLQN